MTRAFSSLAEFKAAVGEELGTSEWLEITQERVNLFADATGDHQWIHVDPERAANGPFGGTIMHGYLTLSLLAVFVDEIYTIGGLAMGINYGTNKVRFPSPVRVGSRVRATATLKKIDEKPIGTQATITFVVEVEGSDKPACWAEVLFVMSSE